jgi:NodT family efflux transporter outer membrane factor (OMF) lipoprotein
MAPDMTPSNDQSMTHGDRKVNRQPWQQGLSLLILTAVLSGCAGFGTEQAPAKMLTPDQLALQPATKAGPQNGWWRKLNDPQLNKLIDTAVANSPTLQQADARIRQAIQAAGIVESRDGLQVDAGLAADRQKFSQNSLTGSELQAAGYKLIQNNYTAQLSAAWSLDIWGKNAAATRAALGVARSAEFDAVQSRLVLSQSVIAQYTTLQRQLEQKTLNESRIRLAETRLALTHARVSAGLQSADSQRQIEMQLASLRAQTASLDADAQRARHALAALAGQAPGSLDGLTPGRLGPAPAFNEGSLTADLLGQRPDIASRRAQVEAMRESVKEARAEFYPNVEISGLIGLQSLAWSNFLSGSSRMFDVSPAITLPVFHSGQLQSNLHQQQAAYDMAVDSYNQAVVNGLRDAADALSGQRQAQLQLTQAQASVASSRKASDAMLSRFRVGLVNKLNLLDTQDAELTQQSSRIEAEAYSRLSWANLNIALGGGLLASPAQR